MHTCEKCGAQESGATGLITGIIPGDAAYAALPQHEREQLADFANWLHPGAQLLIEIQRTAVALALLKPDVRAKLMHAWYVAQR